jgi:general L-amino acid transport system permease protein
VAFAGIVLATVLGVLIGVARLSSNWLVRKAAGAYVETVRNIPPLLVIFVMWFSVVQALPAIQDATNVADLLVLSNREVGAVSFVLGGGAAAFAVVVALALAAAVAVAGWRTRLQARTGRPHRRILWGGTLLAVVVVAAYLLLDGPITLSRPAVEGRRLQGGVAMSASYAALLAALVVYTASHVAEIVRGSIQAVPRGQTEAATALALSDFQRLRFVVLPQAFRIAVPPIINQYLNLTKNSSLGIAIAYPEITRLTGIVIANGNPAPQAIAILMLIYLSFSLFISAVSNVVNRRLQLVER